MTQHTSTIGQRHQSLQNQCRIMVMNTAFITITIARRSKLPNRLCQRCCIGQELTQAVLTPAFALLTHGTHDFQRQIFAAVHLWRFGWCRNIPIGRQAGQLRIVDRLKILGAHNVQEQAVTARQQGQIQILITDTETMTPQSNQLAITFIKIGAVLQRSEALIAQRFDPAVDVIGLDWIMQLMTQSVR